MDVEQAVAGLVEASEHTGHVPCRVPPLQQPLARPDHEQDPVAVLPDVRELVADDADGHRHVQHAADDEDGHHQGAGAALGRHVAVTHGRHRDDGEPHGLGEGLDVVARLDDVDEAGEGQDQDEEREEQKAESLEDGLEKDDEEVILLEAPQHLESAEDRHHAEQEGLRQAGILVDGEEGVGDYSQHQRRHRRDDVHDVVEVLHEE
mmetsp:Transcript_15498/g.48931  ORF Transcript_15498/g.48931 Transcript_15498/m.48931 type:complete len:206 (-) Transcript_15498:89-706(-)